MPETPNRGYTYPVETDPAQVPADMAGFLGQIDADVEELHTSKVRRDDPRLSDPRPPTSHTHPVSDVVGLSGRLSTAEQAIASHGQRLTPLEAGVETLQEDLDVSAAIAAFEMEVG